MRIRCFCLLVLCFVVGLEDGSARTSPAVEDCLRIPSAGERSGCLQALLNKRKATQAEIDHAVSSWTGYWQAGDGARLWDENLRNIPALKLYARSGFSRISPFSAITHELMQIYCRSDQLLVQFSWPFGPNFAGELEVMTQFDNDRPQFENWPGYTGPDDHEALIERLLAADRFQVIYINTDSSGDRPKIGLRSMVFDTRGLSNLLPAYRARCGNREGGGNHGA